MMSSVVLTGSIAALEALGELNWGAANRPCMAIHGAMKEHEQSTTGY
jgi:hypothetical protein